MNGFFTRIDGLDEVYLVRLSKLSCVALRLADGNLCLYSPVAGLEQMLAGQVSEVGPISTFLAPNHYHNKGLLAHSEAFPEATFCCTKAARPRLTKITGLEFDDLEQLKTALPFSVTMHEPEGLKTGEVWLQITSSTECVLVVTDAFSAAIHPPGAFGTEASLLTTFPRYGVKDTAAYKSWATAALSNISPTMLLPCHGSPVRAADLTTQLTRLLAETF